MCGSRKDVKGLPVQSDPFSFRFWSYSCPVSVPKELKTSVKITYYIIAYTYLFVTKCNNIGLCMIFTCKASNKAAEP